MLEAEKEAAKVVQQARQRSSVVALLLLSEVTLSLDRVQRLKDARSEASKEVEGYKMQKEQEYKVFESKVIVSSSTGSMISSHVIAISYSTLDPRRIPNHKWIRRLMQRLL